jgi:galactokinase
MRMPRVGTPHNTMTLSSGSETNRLSESVRAARLFADRFGVAPALTAYSPGRVNLIGEHTDYNDGFVMPFAIDRGVCMAIGPREGTEAEIWTEFDPDGLARFSLNDPISHGPPAWSS